MRLLRTVVRTILRCKANETIDDAVTRHKTNGRKFLYRRQVISPQELEQGLSACGITTADAIMVHASWRSFFSYTGTPASVIAALLRLIGPAGTLVMPCYGKNTHFFDVDNDPSAAGVLSEVFRTEFPSMRSRGAHFSCAAMGKHADDVIHEHERSRYGFDEHGPYFKFSKLEHAKIVMLGLGQHSVKLSLYHLPEMLLRETDPFYKNIFQKADPVTVTYLENGKQVEYTATDLICRGATKPDKAHIRELYKQPFCTHRRIKNLDVVVLDAQPALTYLLEQARRGIHMIRPCAKRPGKAANRR